MGAHPMRKFLETAGGFILVAAGLIMAIPGVPGPGIAVIILGLVLLAKHYHWAHRTLEWVKQKAEKVKNRVLKPERTATESGEKPADRP